MCPCRGRKRGRRWISEIPSVCCFLPEGGPRVEAISISLEELEAVRLADLLDLDQEEAAFYMGISRKAFWNDLTNARRKIAAALVYGMGIKIEGGSFALRGDLGDKVIDDQSRRDDIQLMKREIEFLKSRLEQIGSKLSASEPDTS